MNQATRNIRVIITDHQSYESIVKIPAGMSDAEAQHVIKDLNPVELHNGGVHIPDMNFSAISVEGKAPDDAKASFILQQQCTFGFLEDES